jgi:hypothetical protein
VELEYELDQVLEEGKVLGLEVALGYEWVQELGFVKASK